MLHIPGHGRDNVIMQILGGLKDKLLAGCGNFVNMGSGGGVFYIFRRQWQKQMINAPNYLGLDIKTHIKQLLLVVRADHGYEFFLSIKLNNRFQIC